MQIANRTRSKRAEKLACIQAAMASLGRYTYSYKPQQQGKQAKPLRVNGAAPPVWMGVGRRNPQSSTAAGRDWMKCSRAGGLLCAYTEGCAGRDI
ncbi:hypothetical protein CCMA1212_003647 [Trichoderma ghanense]|uniref:Uncharacterized protein n=1 Tax=Trichoderma ghanense TaxID=65468 RepID=A0ABY2H7B6_9HYPO